MKLIPAIDLLKGKCVRLVKGNFNQKKEFGNDPVKQAKFWEKLETMNGSIRPRLATAPPGRHQANRTENPRIES